MTPSSPRKSSRRTFLKRAAAAAAVGAVGVGAAGYWLGSVRRVSRSAGKKVIVIGIDGMDPRLSERMMNEGQLPNLTKLRAAGGFSDLGTSIPPQSPVAWANFINGAGPGSHGIFDFVHRHTHDKITPFYSAAETVPGEGFWEVGEHKLQLGRLFNHKPPATLLRRQGVPFWDYLDEAGIPSTFYDLPSNYPPSPSRFGHHRCLSGMGTPDMLGEYPVYQRFSEAEPKTEPEVEPEVKEEEGGRRSRLTFEDDTARAQLIGPQHSFLKNPHSVNVDFLVHRDREANAAVIEVQGKKILLKPGMWSRWTTLEFELSMPYVVPNKTLSGICRFYLQEVAPRFRLYVSPINIDPRDPAVPISEPPSFVQEAARKLGPFYTTGFQEDYKARYNNVFNDDEFQKQADLVLEERLALLEYAIQNYDDGLLFFYFSSSDLQSHMFWWDSEEKHPIRQAPGEAQKYFGHIKRLYQKLDAVIGDLVDRYGSVATLIVMSDHGFANWGRQFNLNSWLRDFGHLNPPECTAVLQHADWSTTKAYGLGINGLYLNLKGREPLGIVEPGAEREELLTILTNQLLRTSDPEADYRPVIRNVYRADQIYSGDAIALAPDLIIGYHRGYRASWETGLGFLTKDALFDNDKAWSADHCADALEVPGVLWCNRALRSSTPSLVDIAPSILTEYGLPIPPAMTGKNVFGA
jgi:predicted AlkP superfamily phosphohydrolase/phosphomutase